MPPPQPPAAAVCQKIDRNKETATSIRILLLVGDQETGHSTSSSNWRRQRMGATRKIREVQRTY